MTRKKLILLLQGGGALGAFQCGAWRSLASFLRKGDHDLVLVAGASIGAVNAALIARHYREADSGVGALERFWRQVLARPSLPFVPPMNRYLHAWNGLLTGLLHGNEGLFRPAYGHWSPLGEWLRFRFPLYATDNAVLTLSREFGEYRGDDPILAVAASDVRSGAGLLFDSLSRTITPQIVRACASIPLLFPPATVDGGHLWDFEMRKECLLPFVFDLLRRHHAERGETDAEDFVVVLVDMLNPEGDKLPESGMESQYRLMNIMLGNKLAQDRVPFDLANRQFDMLDALRQRAGTRKADGVATALEEAYRQLVADRLGRFQFVHIGRRPAEYEHVSRDFDYSPDRIDLLIAQGQEAAQEALRHKAAETHKKTGPPKRARA